MSNALSRQKRIQELARMLGGEVITETTRRHAQEMLEHPRTQSDRREKHDSDNRHEQKVLHRNIRLPDERAGFRKNCRELHARRHESRRRNAPQADVIILNTCSVREKAVQKVYARLGELKRQKGNGKILLSESSAAWPSSRAKRSCKKAPSSTCWPALKRATS